jgi:hypothetical protein
MEKWVDFSALSAWDKCTPRGGNDAEEDDNRRFSEKSPYLQCLIQGIHRTCVSTLPYGNGRFLDPRPLITRNFDFNYDLASTQAHDEDS